MGCNVRIVTQQEEQDGMGGDCIDWEKYINIGTMKVRTTRTGAEHIHRLIVTPDTGHVGMPSFKKKQVQCTLRIDVESSTWLQNLWVLPSQCQEEECVKKKYDISEYYLYKNSCSDLLWWGLCSAGAGMPGMIQHRQWRLLIWVQLSTPVSPLCPLSGVSPSRNTSLVTSHCPWPTSPPPVSDGGKEVLQHWHSRPVFWLDH